MNDDRLLESLAQMLRDDERAAEPFERRLHGELADEAVTADRGDEAKSEEMNLALDLYRPLTAIEQDHLFSRVEATLATMTHAPASTVQPTATTEPRHQSGGGFAKIVKMRFLAPLAVAAALGLFFVTQGEDRLPAYAMTASGGESELRGAAEGANTSTLRVRNGSAFELVLRPEKAASGAVAARVFVQRPSGTTELKDVGVDVSNEGSVRVRGRLAEVEPGSKLIAVVGRPSAVANAHGQAARDTQAFEVTLVAIP